MKLISWNIQWGLGADRHLDLGRIIREARRLADFDVLCLQEVADNLPELEASLGEDQLAELALCLPGFTAIPGFATDILAQDGRRARYGNVIFSRHPVLRALRHSFPLVPEPRRSTARTSAALRPRRAMTRSAVEAVIAFPGGPIRVLTTHLEYASPIQRAFQVERIREVHAFGAGRARHPFADAPAPFAQTLETASTIVCGDFNMPPEDPILARFFKPFSRGTPRLLDAWKAKHPRLPHPPSFHVHEGGKDGTAKPQCADYTLISAGLKPRVQSMVYDQSSQASDHQPMILTLTDR